MAFIVPALAQFGRAALAHVLEGGAEMRLAIRVVTGAVVVISVAAGSASASPQMIAAAKKAGFPATNCQYCHTEAAPKKDTYKPDTSLNDRGKFLLEDKKARNLKVADVEKLKEFTEKK